LTKNLVPRFECLLSHEPPRRRPPLYLTSASKVAGAAQEGQQMKKVRVKGWIVDVIPHIGCGLATVAAFEMMRCRSR
jgi:hypothetical protein